MDFDKSWSREIRERSAHSQQRNRESQFLVAQKGEKFRSGKSGFFQASIRETDARFREFG